MRVLGLLVALAGLAAGQERASFRFTQTGSEQELYDAATVIRTITQLGEVSADKETNVVSVSGDAEQVRLFRWLAQELNRPRAEAGGAVREMAMGENDVVRILYFAPGANMRNLQEAATVVRALGELRQLFAFQPLRVVVVRGTKELTAMAEWVLERLQAPGERAGAERKLSAEDVVRVSYAKVSLSVQELQQLAVKARQESKVRRLFTYNEARVIATRGTAEQAATVAQVVSGN